MSDRDAHVPDTADLARVEIDGETWTLVLARDLRHPPAKVWRALTEPAHVREWAPFDAASDLGTLGVTHVTWVGAPAPVETRVIRADAPEALAYASGETTLRFELEARGDGTRLTLWAVIDRRFIAMGAAGWHVALDVLRRFLDGTHVGRIAGAEALGSDDWRQLHAAYTRRFASLSPPLR